MKRRPPRQAADGGTTSRETPRDRPAELGGRFGGIGLPESAGWYVSAALYWLGGLTVLIMERASGGEMVNQTVGILATAILACTPLLVLGGRYLPNVWWGPHLRIMLPMVILGVGAFVAGPSIGSLVLITMFPILAIAYLHEPRVSVPYAAVCVGYMLIALSVFSVEPSRDARVLVMGGAMIVVAGGLIYAQQRLRSAAALNHKLSVTDPLTGLANLRRLQDRLAREIQRSTRSGSQIVIYAIDLDDFKQVNDQFSYELGDAVLRAVGKSLAAEMQTGDLLVRRGGDEFAVLTIETEGRRLDQFADRISQAIERARFAVCPEVNPAASVTYLNHRDGESAEDFLRRVDDSLHESKLDAHPERRIAELATGKPVGPVELFSADMDNERAMPGQSSLAFAVRNTIKPDVRAEWLLTTGAIATPAILLAAAAVSGLAADLSVAIVAAGIVVIAACAMFGLLAAYRRWPRALIHLPLAISTIAMTVAIEQSDQSRQALIELYAIQPPLVIYFLGLRAALPYAITSAGAYTYFLTSSDYPNATLRILLFAAAMAALCVMLVRGQRRVHEFSLNAAMLSIIDPLTGVANLRGLHRRIEDEVDRCRQTGDDMALMVVDLDGFKFVNDRYSHTVGDTVLIESARAMYAVVREDELVARRGGDEFAIVCVPSAHADMQALAQRVADSIAEARGRLTRGIPTGATVRYLYWDHTESADHFMRRADEELHYAKATSRRAADDTKADKSAPDITVEPA
ncbi:MAG: diguanylate cyclase [Solirubrobacterales bacterium]